MRGISIIIIFAFSPACYAIPYNVKDAFCRDKLSKHNSNYTNAKIYNHCIKNADRLIKQYENEKVRREREWKKQSKEAKRRIEKQKLEEQKRKQQKKAEERQRKIEEENEKKRIDNLFRTKFD